MRVGGAATMFDDFISGGGVPMGDRWWARPYGEWLESFD
jgi:hypothetical protein